MTKGSRFVLTALWLAISTLSMTSCTDGQDEHDATTSDAVAADASGTGRSSGESADNDDQSMAGNQDRQAHTQRSTASERELARALDIALSCQRAETLRTTLAANPMADQQARASLVEADNKCSQAPGYKNADLQAMALRAAKLGNAAAAACFVSGALRPLHSVGAKRASADALYKNETPALVKQGIAAGTWAMVAEAAAINSPRSANSPYFALNAPDPVKGYTYLKLLELGAEGDEKLDLKLVALERSVGIDETRRKEADHVAKQMYQDYFHNSGPYSHEQAALCTNF